MKSIMRVKKGENIEYCAFCEQVAWKYLYDHIQMVLENPTSTTDVFLMSRCSDIINKLYKNQYNRFPATGEVIE